MYEYKDIRNVHLEPTEKCQAVCPMCPRNVHGGKENPFVINAELTLDDCKQIFEPKFIKQLDTMYMCGNYGDPILAKDTAEIMLYFRNSNPDMYLRMHTNGGARKAEWWDRLAKIICHKGRGEVTFSVDGLRDTNHIYRQNVKWDLVERNMKAFIAGGGKAVWDYLVFKHNEHQVDEAKELSKKWGFDQFLIKKTSRFYSYSGGKSSPMTGNIFQVLDKDGNNTHILEPPTEETYRNEITDQADQIKEKHSERGMDDFYNTTKIDPKCVTKQEIYISSRGYCLPCCWMGATLHRWESGNDQTNQGWNFINNIGGGDAINAIKTPIKYIIEESGLFQNIRDSWDIPTITEGKLAVCTRLCAAKFDTDFQFNEGQDYAGPDSETVSRRHAKRKV
jgi:MoaA/NifB/PqqE/SkfB family radical SAM enzyme